MTSNNKKPFKTFFNQPIYERSSVSSSLLSQYPQYRELFMACPSCGKNSLKPIGYKKMTPAHIRSNSGNLERVCGLCGFIQKPMSSFEVEKESNDE